MCTMDSGYTVTTCGHRNHANTHTMTQDSQENGLKTYVHTLHMYVHTCMQTHIRTYVYEFKGCVCIHMIIVSVYIHLIYYTYVRMCMQVCMYICTYTHACSRDEGHTCANTLTKVETVSLGMGEKAPI